RIYTISIHSKAQVLYIKTIYVCYNFSSRFQAAQIYFQCGGIHCNKHITGIAGCKYTVTGKSQLKSTHTGQRSLRCTNFCGKIGKGGKVNAKQGCIVCKLRTGKLHSVSTVTGK